MRTLCEGYEVTFWGDENVLYLDWGRGYTDGCINQN